MLANPGFQGAKFGFLSENCEIHIDHAPACLVQPCQSLVDEDTRITILESGVGIGVRVADVAISGGPEQGIRYGMEDHVGIAVAEQAARMVNTHTAEQERPALHQTVRVVSDAYPHFCWSSPGNSEPLTSST